MRADELRAYLFGFETHPLAMACERWLADSDRFCAFVDQHRDKIRKKQRPLDAEGLLDLQLELNVAYRLLRDRRVELGYELFSAAKTRGPDFTVRFRSHVAFTVEVKRLRGNPSEGRLIGVLCDKLGQLPPSSVNVVLMATIAPAERFDPAEAMNDARRRAERGEDDLFTQRGLRGARDYLRHMNKLSGMLFWQGWGEDGGERDTLWLNTQARHPVPVEVATLLSRL